MFLRVSWDSLQETAPADAQSWFQSPIVPHKSKIYFKKKQNKTKQNKTKQNQKKKKLLDLQNVST